MGKAKQVTQLHADKTPQQDTGSVARFRDPFREMERLFQEMSMRNPFTQNWFTPFRQELKSLEPRLPRVDVIDRDRDVLIRAEIPGVEKEDLEISMNGSTITFRGKSHKTREEEEGEYHYKETSSGEFYRTVTLPAEVESEDVKAKYKNGIVELTLPKVKAMQRKKVNIKLD